MMAAFLPACSEWFVWLGAHLERTKILSRTTEAFRYGTGRGLHQNKNRAPNCTCRGLLTWLVIVPNPPSPTEPLGSPNLTRLVKLKNSVRSCSFMPSLIW